MMMMTEESRMFDRLSISRYAPLNVMDYVQSFDDQFSLLFYIIGIWFALQTIPTLNIPSASIKT